MNQEIFMSGIGAELSFIIESQSDCFKLGVFKKT